MHGTSFTIKNTVVHRSSGLYWWRGGSLPGDPDRRGETPWCW